MKQEKKVVSPQYFPHSLLHWIIFAIDFTVDLIVGIHERCITSVDGKLLYGRGHFNRLSEQKPGIRKHDPHKIPFFTLTIKESATVSGLTELLDLIESDTYHPRSIEKWTALRSEAIGSYNLGLTRKLYAKKQSGEEKALGDISSRDMAAAHPC